MSLPRLDLQDAFPVRRAKPPETPHYGRIIIGVSLVLAVFFIYEATTQLKEEPRTSLIRKILRMKCVTDTSTICSTPQGGGMYVVNVGSCEDVYEFNGIPFTDLLQAHDSYYVPSSNDLTLVMQHGCKEITASIDTLPMPQLPHASNREQQGVLKRIVWVTKCTSTFTLMVGDEVLLENTPSGMLESKKLKTMIAYIYILDRLTGSVSVTSECNYPIYVYTLRV